MQGIVSILRSDNPENTTKGRRTLSADMSSKRWLPESGLPAMKKIASCDHIAIDHSSSSSESDEECDQVTGDNPRPRIDIWTAIMSQKKQDDSGDELPPPYVHPLVKKSASSLSEKSLKVCTESLGSETGSDVFSGDVEQKQQQHAGNVEQEQNDEYKIVKPASLTTKKPQQARPLPPPIPSLAAARTDGQPSLHMNSRRVDGRLVVEAVSVPPQKFYEAQREDGRFLLTFINDQPEEQPPENEFVDVFNVFEEEKDNDTDHEEEDDDDIIGILKDRPLNYTKMTERDNENPSWSRNPKVSNNYLSKSLATQPPRTTGRPPPPAATSVNSYQYLWRAKPTVASVIDPMISQHRPPTKNKDMVLLRGNKADCSLIPSLKCCKEPRRSLMMWEPFCIATS